MQRTKRGANHHCCTRGKRVYVKLDDGQCFVDKFKEEHSAYLIFEKYGRIKRNKIVLFKIARGDCAKDKED